MLVIFEKTFLDCHENSYFSAIRSYKNRLKPQKGTKPCRGRFDHEGIQSEW
jgi:hypothetical protein